MAAHDKRLLRWIGGIMLLCAWVAAVMLDVQFSYGFVGFHSILAAGLICSMLLTIAGGVRYAARRRPRLVLVGLASLALVIAEFAIGAIIQHRKIEQSYVAAGPLIAAIEAYRRDHGRPPEKLDELIPAYIVEIPDTAMKWFGTPFEYWPEGAEYRLSFEKPLLLRAVYRSSEQRWLAAD